MKLSLKFKFLVIFVLFFIWQLMPAQAEEQNLNFVNQFLNNSEITLIAGDYQEKVKHAELIDWVSINPVLDRNTKTKAEAENIHYCPVNRLVCERISTLRQKIFVQKKYQARVKDEDIRSFLNDLARNVNKDPVSAKFQIEDGKVTVFSLSQNGMKLNVDESANVIKEMILKNKSAGQTDLKAISLKYENIKPEISSAENLGIQELIGEGRSNFKGSPKNRIFNINVAAGRFNGVLIKPGEEFSFVTVLGPVDGEHGYLPELVIKKDKTEPEFGGGICQVSTTAFRAAIWSGLKITARRNHAYPVKYYNPQGMDATVYVPRPDLRFINNTPNHILIQTKIEGTELIFDFYGTSDGRKTEIDGPKITERNPDGSMKAVFTQKVYDKDGNSIVNDTFKSAYDSPSKYPHPGEEILSHKPDDWSKKQWEDYKKAHGM